MARHTAFLEKYRGLVIRPTLTPEDLIYRKKCEDDCYFFAKEAWPHFGAFALQDTWHLQAGCEHIEAMYDNIIKNIVVNWPPITGKTNLWCVIIVAWFWIRRPSTQFICISYSQTLALDSATKCLQLVKSAWYQKYWGGACELNKESASWFSNISHGSRRIATTTGTLTGLHADVLIVDDPDSASSVESEVARDTAHYFMDSVLPTRINNPNTCHFVLSQQRLNEKDCTGHILAKKDPAWIHFRLPMKFEPQNACVTVPLKSTNGKPWKDPRTYDKELLCPTRLDSAAVEAIERSFANPATVAAQLQMRPAPAEGNIVKRHWFRLWQEDYVPKINYILQSWDTALLEAEPGMSKARLKKICYSACTTWGVFDDKNGVSNVILLSMWRGRVGYPDLEKMALRLSLNYKDTNFQTPREGNFPVDLVIIEAKANGLSLLQSLRRKGVVCARYDPSRFATKEARCKAATPLLEVGRCWVPTIKGDPDKIISYAEFFIEKCIMFPHGEANDLVDTMSQAIDRLKSTGMITHPKDQLPEFYLDYRKIRGEALY